MAYTANRIERIRTMLSAQNLSCLYIHSLSNIVWITGFERVFDTENAHACFITSERCVLHSDSRYSEALQREAYQTDIDINEDRISHEKALFTFLNECFDRESLSQNSAITIGIEDSIPLSEFRKLEQEKNEWTSHMNINSSAVQFVELSGCIESLREIKDSFELDVMKKAQSITDNAFARILKFMKPGMTERCVQLQLDQFMFEEGAEGLAFDTIVATGSHASSPHAIPGDTKISIGDAVVMDFGAKYKGYCSDMTRTVFIGQPSEELQHAFSTLRTINETCEALIKEGIKASVVHEQAETMLTDAGYKGKMGHSLGHSVGIDIHESPTLSPSNSKTLEKGNVVTVEPGIYLPGKFGMRLEDFGVVRETGFEVFTQSSHKMFIIDKLD